MTPTSPSTNSGRTSSSRSPRPGRPPSDGWRRPLAALAAVLLAAPLAGCAVNPATGEQQLILISRQQEIRMGRQGAEQVEDRIGLYEEGETDAYVSEMGQEMAAGTERPDLPWSFEIADDASVNAFALPGGFIYVTRGILAYFNSGAELATVVGHEIGHVTARHSAEQMSRQQLAALGLGIGGLVSDEFAQFQGLAGAGLNVLFMKYSRDDERQADDLGIRYMLQEDYDPREALDVFRMLDRQSGGGGSVPGWLSTHPAPGDRLERIRQILDTIPAGRLRGTDVDRGTYLQMIDGMVFGPDPRDGYFLSDLFVHPRLELSVRFPSGWERRRLTRLAVAQSQAGDAVVRWAVSDSGSREAAARGFESQRGVQVLDRSRTAINGAPAVLLDFRARTQEQNLRGRAAFVDLAGRTVEVTGYAAAGEYERYRREFVAFIRSLERATDPELLDVEPMRIDLIRVSAPQSISEIRERRGAPVSADVLALMNAVEAGERLEEGRTIKWVMGEGPPRSE